MIDIHAHILPGADDGADGLSAALAMAEMAVSCGVTAIVATPHSGLPHQQLSALVSDHARKLEALRSEIEKAALPLRLLPGMEIFGTRDTARLLAEGKLITLNRSRYPLIEFPFEGYAHQATEVLASVLELGLRPVVAHPERYLYVQADPVLLNLWADMGCLFQVNRGSLLGRFGPREEALAYAMVERRFVCAVASDGHSPHSRTTWMRDIHELLAEEFSPQTAHLLTEEFPRLLVENAHIPMQEPNWF